MEIKISKSQWEQAGREAGWLEKEALGMGGEAPKVVPKGFGAGTKKAPEKTTAPMKVQAPGGQPGADSGCV